MVLAKMQNYVLLQDYVWMLMGLCILETHGMLVLEKPSLSSLSDYKILKY